MKNLSDIVNTSIFLFAIISNSIVAQQSPAFGNGIVKDKKRISLTRSKTSKESTFQYLNIDFANKEISINGTISSIIPIEAIQLIFNGTIIIDTQLSLSDQEGNSSSFRAVNRFFGLPTELSCINCPNNPICYTYNWSCIFDYSNDELLKNLSCSEFENLEYQLTSRQLLEDLLGRHQVIPTTSNNFECQSDQSIWPFECFNFVDDGIIHSGQFLCSSGPEDISTIVAGMENPLKESIFDELIIKPIIYPNPMSSKSNLFVSGINEGVINLKLIDSYGHNIDFNAIRLGPKIKLELSHLNKGIYFLSIITKGNKQISKTILVN